MKPNKKTATIIGGLVTLAAALGALIFVLSGSQGITWFVLIGIPLILVGGITVYVRGVIAQTGTSEGQFVRTRARVIAEEYQTVLRQINELRLRYPNFKPQVDATLDSIGGDFNAQGVRFNVETGAFDLGNISDGDIQEFERLSSEVERVDKQIESEFREFANEEISRIDQALNRLYEIDLTKDTDSFSALSDGQDVPLCQDHVDGVRDQATTNVEGAIATVREMGRGEARASDVNQIEQELDAATAALDQYDFEGATESILEARDQLREQFSGSFDSQQDDILNLIKTVEQANIDPFVEASEMDNLSNLKSTVEGIDSALDLPELTLLRAELRQICVGMIETMQSDLDSNAQTLRTAELPPGYYTEPAIVGEHLIDSFDSINDLNAFADHWRTVAEELRVAVDTTQTKAAVVSAYDDVAEQIEQTLEQKGEVTGDDLPMRYPDQFLGLYFRQNDGVEFDPRVPVLRRGDIETYDLAVDVTYERGSERPRTATLELNGGGHNETKTIETRVAATASFEAVPKGRHTLSADPGDDDFNYIEREIQIDDNQTVTIEFFERGLREQLCSDIDADIESLLPEMRPRLESLLDQDGYVSSEMDLPVRPAFAPCLLAVWSEQTNRGLCRDTTEIIVYDNGQLMEELTNVLRYNIEAGDQLRYDDLRRNFLSAPVSNEVIRDLISQIDSKHSVETTQTGLEIQ